MSSVGNIRLGRLTIITNLPQMHLAKHGLKYADHQLDHYLAKPNQTEAEEKANKQKSWMYPLYDSTMPQISFEDAIRIVNNPQGLKGMNRGQFLNLARAFIEDDAKKLGLETVPEAFLTNDKLGKINAARDGLLVGIMSNPANGAACFVVRLLQEIIHSSLRGVRFEGTDVIALNHKLRRTEFSKNNIPAHETFHIFQGDAMNGLIDSTALPSEKTLDAWGKSKKFPRKLLYPFHQLESSARKHGKEYAAELGRS